MKRDAVLWLAIFTGPIVWFVSFNANFALVPWACALGWKPALYAISCASLLITAAAGWAAWSQWQQLGRDEPGETAGVIPRSRVLASGGVLLSAVFFLVIAAQSISHIILGACE
jgi:hypothetical protein